MTFISRIPKLFLSFLLIASISMISCKNEQESSAEAMETPPAATLEQKKQALQNVAPASNTTQSTGGAINPAHGQPGHRCDIPVGAPLDGGTSTPLKKVTPQSQNTVPTGGAGLNPPHGQPGHRCDIKVGDPL